MSESNKMHEMTCSRKDKITRQNLKNVFTKKPLLLSVFNMVNVEVRC